MIANYEQLVKHNKEFIDAFVDLKIVGWNTYSNAMNKYTFNFFKTQMNSMDKAVAKFGNIMKGDFNDK
jgi:hypothetical protein